MKIHINFTKTHRKELKRGTCLDCKKYTWFVLLYQEWYGWTRVCLRCGRRWEDGEWMPLEFLRTARRDSIDFAKERYRRKLDEGEII